MSKNIKEIIDSIKKAKKYNEVSKIFENLVNEKEIEKIDEITYRKDDYIIKDVLKFNGENYAKILKALTDKNVSVAPKFVDGIPINDDMILIYEISGMENKDLLSLSDGYEMLDDNAKNEAYKDIERLLNVGLVNSYATKEDSIWHVIPKTKKLIISDWSTLKTVKEEEKKEILDKFYKIIFKK